MAYNFGSSSSSAATVVVKTAIPSATSNYVIAQITPTSSKIETWEISVNIQDEGNDRNKSWQIVQVTTHWIGGALKVLGAAINLANGTSGPAIWTFTYTASISNLLEIKCNIPTLSGTGTARIAYLLLNTQDGTLTHPVITPETYFSTKLLSWIDVEKTASLSLTGSTCTSIADARGGAYPAWTPTTQNGYGMDAGFQYYSSGFNGTSMPFVGNSNTDVIDPAPNLLIDKAWTLTCASGLTHVSTDKYLLGVVVNLGVYWTGGYRLFQDSGGSVIQFSTPVKNSGPFTWSGVPYESGPAVFTFQLYNGACVAKMYIPNVALAYHTNTVANVGSRTLTSGLQTILEVPSLHRAERIQLCEFALISDHTDSVADEAALASMLRLKWGV